MCIEMQDRFSSRSVQIGQAGFVIQISRLRVQISTGKTWDQQARKATQLPDQGQKQTMVPNNITEKVRKLKNKKENKNIKTLFIQSYV